MEKYFLGIYINIRKFSSKINFIKMNREESLKKISNKTKWDLIIIGVAATGLGISLDATVQED